MTTKKVFWAGNQSELSLFISDYSDSTYTDRVELIKKVFSKQRSPQCESALTFQFFTRPNPIWLDPLREVIEDSKSYNSALDLYGCILGIKNSLGRVERRYETWAKSFQNGKETSRMPCKLHSDLVKLNLQNDPSNILGGGLDASRLQLAVCQNWLFCKPRRAKRP